MILNLKPTPFSFRERIGLLILLFAGAIGLYAGWRLFWFLTDDAFIAFRYVSNSILGHGYVWNPPPFRPVEGYTSFLWVAFLDGVWRTLGIEPPVSANWLALAFSGLTLLLASAMVLQLRWSDRLRSYRVGFVALLLLGTLTNRTFLAWTSSGLETAMFNFFVTLWLYAALFRPPLSSASSILMLSTASAAVALTRPDGYLYAAAAVGLTGMTLLKERGRLCWTWFLATLPFGIPVLHALWRRHFYGTWLPNTYYAKRTTAWPESGGNYLHSFVLEYALWFWLAIMGVILLRHAWCYLRDGRSVRISDRPSGFQAVYELGVRLIPVLTLAFHLLFYTLLIGGDHFEYRVLSHLIPLLFVALIWAVNSVEWRLTPALGTVLACICLSWPVPWVHWAAAQRRDARPYAPEMAREMILGPVPIEHAFPKALRGYTRAFDQLQDWMLLHYVCVRYHGHRYFWRQQVADSPSREEGLGMSGEDFPVLATHTVGILGWVLPRVNIIDLHGLNDYVVARTPHPWYMTRHMAHERYPPSGYVEDFVPNVTLEGKKITVTPRAKALTAADIIAIERRWVQKVGQPLTPSR
ncbi:MAG: hypothetical protein WCS01_01710 [bacterium]